MAVDFSIPVLVVDDYRAVARIMARLLNQAGFHDVDEATDGDEALARMRERKYGLVLSDWHMNPKSGLDLLNEAKADEKLRDTPFILVSAEESPEKMAVARKSVASGYVVKPFDAQTLKARITSVLRA
jgi:two-component system, chemotaxis family, chemotaxis protein CheY